MWFQVMALSAAVASVACASSSIASPKHLQELRLKSPYALLGDDYGILNRDDLLINDCAATPVPFTEQSTSYLYWQCFEANTSKLFCDGNGYDKSEEERLTVMVVSGIRESELHEYTTNRAVPLASCQEFVKDWKTLVRDEKHVCVSGSFSSRKKNEAGRWVSQWAVDRFKTKKGCESYFVGGCSLRHQLTQGCKLQARK